jgi:hypothetical protein
MSRETMNKRSVKRIALTMIMLAAAWHLFAQQEKRQQFNLSGGRLYRDDLSTLDFTVEGKALVVSGTASGVPKGGGGYIVPKDGGGYIIALFLKKLEFSGSKKLIIKACGISERDNFNMYKLLKLELNGKARRTISPKMKNKNDPDYINARNNEEAEFDISGIWRITSINLVFYDCTMNRVKIDVFYE